MLWYIGMFVIGMTVGIYITWKVMRILLRTETRQFVIAHRALKDIANWDKQPGYDRYLSTPEAITDHAIGALREINDVDVPPVKPKQKQGEA